jgi:SH3 domain-containing protein
VEQFNRFERPDLRPQGAIANRSRECVPDDKLRVLRRSEYINTLNTARRAVPVVDFALGAAGVAAAAAIVVGFLGYSRATFIIFGGARLLSVRSDPILVAGIAMVAGIGPNDPQGLNVRNGPDQFCPSVGAVPVGARDVTVHSCEPGPTDRLMWCRITFNGVSGFALADHLKAQN